MNESLSIVFPLYPGAAPLDFIGPWEVFRYLPGAECTPASLDGGTLELGAGVALTQLSPLAEVQHCDLICVPGGFGVTDMLTNSRFVREIARLAKGASTVSSVCSGSLLLGAAGLLVGKRAACHWVWRNLLSSFGATPDAGRVVRDGHVVTGGGVTAGIDLALRLAAERAGENYAAGIELALEYAPEPPFSSGRPELAAEQIVRAVRERFAVLRPAREAAVLEAESRLSQPRTRDEH